MNKILSKLFNSRWMSSKTRDLANLTDEQKIEFVNDLIGQTKKDNLIYDAKVAYGRKHDELFKLMTKLLEQDQRRHFINNIAELPDKINEVITSYKEYENIRMSK